MPKLKTKKGLAKRFKLTKSGKIKRAKAGRGHLLAKKSRKRKRLLRKSGLVSKSDKKTIKMLLPY
jgi:large subunit ribosomal protein L35